MKRMDSLMIYGSWSDMVQFACPHCGHRIVLAEKSTSIILDLGMHVEIMFLEVVTNGGEFQNSMFRDHDDMRCLNLRSDREMKNA